MPSRVYVSGKRKRGGEVMTGKEWRWGNVTGMAGEGQGFEAVFAPPKGTVSVRSLSAITVGSPVAEKYEYPPYG